MTATGPHSGRTNDTLREAVVEDGGYPDLTIESYLLRSARGISYHEDEMVYRLEYDPSIDKPSRAVVAAVATMTHTDPLDLDPLYREIDTDAFNDLFAPTLTDTGQRGQVHFQYSGFEVRATSHGVIEVDPR